jgi:hypothetical protein
MLVGMLCLCLRLSLWCFRYSFGGGLRRKVIVPIQLCRHLHIARCRFQIARCRFHIARCRFQGLSDINVVGLFRTFAL